MCTSEMTCDICKDWSAAQWERFIKKRTYKDRKKTSRPSGSVPPASLTSPRAETLSEVSQTGTFSSSFSCPSGGQGRREGSQGAPGVVSWEASSPPAGSRSRERGGSVSGLSSVARERAPSSAPSGAGEGVVAQSQRTSLARSASSAVSPHSSPHVRRHGELRETSEDRSRVLSLRDSRSSDREPRKDKRARARSCSSRDRGRRSRSLSSSRSRLRGGEHRRRSSSRSLSSRVRSRRDRSRSSDRYRSRRGGSRSRGDRSRSSDRYGSHRDHWRDWLRSSDRYRSRRQRACSPARRGGPSDRSRSHDPPSRPRDHSWSRGRQPSSSDRSRSEKEGRRARRDQQEGGETVVVSQDPAVSEVSSGVTPVAGGAPLVTLPSAVQDLARFFLNLAGSSSLGAVGGVAGVTASAAGSGVQLCPTTTAGGAVALGAATVIPAGAGVPPAVDAAVPGVPGLQQRREEPCSRRRRSRSSSDGTDRRVKKRTRRRSPSPGTSPPRAGLAPGGAPGDVRSSRAFDRSPRPRTSRSGAREDRYCPGAGRRSPAPSGGADDDRSNAFESVDFDRDDSFRSVLDLIRSFHGMEEPAGVPSARCKTSLASIYGLMSEISPAFSLPASPLVRSLLDDTNLALAKFLEDKTVHGFLPVPGRQQRRYYRTSSSSFPGPYSVPPGITSITLEKVSEAKRRSLSLSASHVSSLETMLSGVCEVSSWLHWWLSTCGGFREVDALWVSSFGIPG